MHSQRRPIYLEILTAFTLSNLIMLVVLCFFFFSFTVFSLIRRQSESPQAFPNTEEWRFRHAMRLKWESISSVEPWSFFCRIVTRDMDHVGHVRRIRLEITTTYEGFSSTLV